MPFFARMLRYQLGARLYNILNSLSGRLRNSPGHCLVLADAIASQLARNGRYEVLIARRFDSYLKRCLTSGRPQHQAQ